MNEIIILQMVSPYVKDSAITYDEFDSLFKFLSIKEQYQVTDVLFNNGINLVDEHSDFTLDIKDEGQTDDIQDDFEDEFKILYDTSIFKDSGFSEDEVLTINKDIRQTNEILCKLIQQGNKQAVQDLCVKNKRLVDKYVLAYQNRYGNRLDFEDLEQVGFLGLIKAAHRFEPEQGTAFSTYAVFWIKQSISREIMDNGYAIRIPVHMMERINTVVSLDNKLDFEGLKLQERIEQIGDELGLTYEEVRECLILKKNYLTYSSLNTPVGEDEESELGEFIPDEGAKETDELVMEMMLHEQLEEVLDTLTEREQNIIRLRFGLEDNRARTLEEIGVMYNVTRERIRQIEEKALRKLRHPSRARKVKDYLD